MLKIILNHIRQWKPSGRFIKLNPDAQSYSDVGTQKAIEKISQLFREKQRDTDFKVVEDGNVLVSTEKMVSIINTLQETNNFP